MISCVCTRAILAIRKHMQSIYGYFSEFVSLKCMHQYLHHAESVSKPRELLTAAICD